MTKWREKISKEYEHKFSDYNISQVLYVLSDFWAIVYTVVQWKKKGRMAGGMAGRRMMERTGACVVGGMEGRGYVR